MNTTKTDNSTAIAISPGTLTLENLLAAICDAVSTGTRESYERVMEIYESLTPMKVSDCVSDFVDDYAYHASGCKHHLIIFFKKVKHQMIIVMKKLRQYMEHSFQLILRSEGYANILRGTYYIWDYFDISDIKSISRMLKESEQMERCIDALEGSRFIHKLNETLKKSMENVKNASSNTISDTGAVSRWVLCFNDDINNIIAMNKKKWDKAVDEYVKRQWDERDAIETLRSLAESAMVESDFYINKGENDIVALVKHIRSMQGNDEGEGLEDFMRYFAQVRYFDKRLNKAADLTGFYKAIYRTDVVNVNNYNIQGNQTNNYGE